MQIIEFVNVTGTKFSFSFSEDYQVYFILISLTQTLYADGLPQTDDSELRIQHQSSSEIQLLEECLGDIWREASNGEYNLKN